MKSPIIIFFSLFFLLLFLVVVFLFVFVFVLCFLLCVFVVVLPLIVVALSVFCCFAVASFKEFYGCINKSAATSPPF